MEEQYDLELTERVKQYGREIGASLVGIADAQVLNEALEQDFRPEDCLPGCRSVVVLSLHIPDGALEIMRRGKMNYSYNMFGYAYLNRELDYLIYRMTIFLENEGYAAMPIPARGTQYGARKPYFGPLSYRHCAVAAGLATFGLNGLGNRAARCFGLFGGSRIRFILRLCELGSLGGELLALGGAHSLHSRLERTFTHILRRAIGLAAQFFVKLAPLVKCDFALVDELVDQLLALFARIG